MTGSTAEPDRDVARAAHSARTALPQRRRAHRRARLRAHRRGGRRRLDPRPAQGLRRDPRGAARPARDAARRRPRDDRDRARLGARAARPPPVRRSTTTRTSTPSSRRSCAPARCSRSPPARRCSPTRSAATRSRQGVYVAACLYLAHRRAGTRFDPSGSSRRPEPFTFIPFGGGTRRCLGAAFATLEMREVLRAVDATVHTQTRRGPKGSGCGAAASPSHPHAAGSIIPLTR